MAQAFHFINDIIRAGLASLKIMPSSYPFLFPPEIKPEQIQEMLDQGVFPTVEGLAPAITYAILLSLARFLLHIFVFKPLAEVSMKIKEVPQKKIKEIDAEFRDPLKFVDTATIKQYCAKSEHKVNDVRKYLWTRKRNVMVGKKVTKYVEAAWRFLFYSAFCILGYQALFVPDTAIWITDTMNHWRDWPLHPVSATISLYYQVELGCYIHQLLWTEVNRSDALQMIFHHFITITLLVASYLNNYTRIGASILLIHDIPDIVLEGAKVLNYTAKAKGNSWLQPVVDGLFVVFMITFFVTRLMVYPRHIMYSVIVEGIEYFGCGWFGCYFFIGLLSALQCLHIFWFYLIARMAYRLVIVGEVEKDVRSDDEDDMDLEPPALEDEKPSSGATEATPKKSTAAAVRSNDADAKEDTSSVRKRKN